jgi:exonuclease VII small subunit
VTDSTNEKRPLLGGFGGGKATAAGLGAVRLRLDRQRTRFDEQRKRFDEQRKRLDALQARFDNQRDRLDSSLKVQERLRQSIEKLQKKLDRANERLRDDHTALNEVTKTDSLREVDFGRAMQQLGSLEARLGSLERDGGEAVVAAPGDEVEARRLLDAVQREHEQIRVRFQVVTSYEERLRRVEAALTKLYDGDDRHPL